ncbi:MAG: ATP-binding protein [Clostridia bacterium]|nr:ATP-binding protein [Clostridia bacterium]
MSNIRNQALASIAKKHETQVRLQEFMLDNALSHKDVEKLYKKCKSLQFDIAKLKYAGSSTTQKEKSLNDTKKELYALLNKYGIDRNSLKVKYNCPICHDKGIVDGKDCECLKHEMSEILLKESGINKDKLPAFSDVYFKIFGEQEKEIRKIYDTLQKYTNTNTTKHVVTITGKVGVGKTHLIECMLNECVVNCNKYVIYTTAVGLNNDMLKYHTSPMDEKGDILQRYFDCDILFVDDLGTENVLKNVTCEYLYQILSERTRLNKNTIITTNLDMQQIMDVYDERIFSRIADQNNCLLIKMDGKDLRTIKK